MREFQLKKRLTLLGLPNPFGIFSKCQKRSGRATGYYRHFTYLGSEVRHPYPSALCHSGRCAGPKWKTLDFSTKEFSISHQSLTKGFSRKVYRWAKRSLQQRTPDLRGKIDTLEGSRHFFPIHFLPLSKALGDLCQRSLWGSERGFGLLRPLYPSHCHLQRPYIRGP